MIHMNPVLIILVLLGGVLLWLLLSFLYRPIGKIAKKLLEEAKESMEDDETENKQRKED